MCVGLYVVKIVLCFMFLANKGDAFLASPLLSMYVHIGQRMCRRVRISWSARWLHQGMPRVVQAKPMYMGTISKA